MRCCTSTRGEPGARCARTGAVTLSAASGRTPGRRRRAGLAVRARRSGARGLTRPLPRPTASAAGRSRGEAGDRGRNADALGAPGRHHRPAGGQGLVAQPRRRPGRGRQRHRREKSFRWRISAWRSDRAAASCLVSSGSGGPARPPVLPSAASPCNPPGGLATRSQHESPGTARHGARGVTRPRCPAHGRLTGVRSRRW